jgi:uncharacterized protein HemY
MSEKHDRDGEQRGPSRPAGVSGSAEKVGRELGDLDFEPDALLDSLTGEDEPEARGSEPASSRSGLPVGHKLHEPDHREYPDDEVTVVGKSDALQQVLSEIQPPRRKKEPPPEPPPLEDLAPDELDELDELLGADQEPLPTLVAPKPIEPPSQAMPSRASVPRPGSPALQAPPPPRKPTLVGLQPNSGPPSIPRPAIPRPGNPLASPAAAPPLPPKPAPAVPAPVVLAPAVPTPVAPKPAPAAPTATFSLDEEEENEVTHLFEGGAFSDAELADLESLAPLLRSDPPQPASEKEREPLSARTTIADDGPADQFLRASAPFPSPELDAPRAQRHSEPAQVSDSDLIELPQRDSALFPEEEVITSVTNLADLEPKATVRAPEGDGETPTGVFNEPGLLRPPAPPSLETPSVPGDAWPSFHDAEPEELRPAAEYLADAGATDEFRARAEWFEREANAKAEPQAKARLLLLASELFAMVGELSKARDLANEAASLARTMALPARQARFLAAKEGDFKAVAAALELEIRSSATPEARVHAAYLSAEVHRLSLLDEGTAKKKLELAVRAQVEDPRAPLQRLAEALGTNASPPQFKWPDQPALAELEEATEELVARRAAQPGPDARPETWLAAARRALSNDNRTLAAQHFEKLRSIRELEAPAAWLVASLLAHESGTRTEALRLLGTLVDGREGPRARRALAARALEQGDGSALAEAVKNRDPAFSPADRVALGALTGAPQEVLDEVCVELSGSPEFVALASAAHAASASPDPIFAGTPSARAEARLGRALARRPAEQELGLGWLRPAIEGFEQTHREHPLGTLLALELALRSHAALPLANAIGEWPADEAGKGHRELARALTLELAGDGDAARAMYEAALAADPACEAALRALLPSLDPGAVPQAFVALAEASPDRTQSALHHLHALLVAPPGDPREVKERLERAVEADPTQPLTYRIAEQLARRRGDADELAHWLRARREVAADDVARALDLVREALLVAESDLNRAAELLGEAVRARPGDVGLRELFERLRPGADTERGEWREAVAAQASPRTKPLLLLQAAFEFERAGEPAAAARTSRAAVDAGGGPLASIMSVRTALGTPEAARVSEELLSRAKDAADPVEQRELYEQLSEFDRARGDNSSAILWMGALLDRSPEHLPALRRLEQAFITTSREEDLEPVAAELARLLEDREGEAHARLAARLRRRSGAWLLTREMAELALRRPEPPLWAIRMLATFARASDDPKIALAAERRLADRADHPLDRATLSLRAAEAATRLGEIDRARELLESALQHAPDHLMALTTLAEVLEAAGDFRGAAKGLEAVAEASSVDAHRVAAWHQAGLLWLERADDAARGRLALEQAVAIDPTHEEAVLRLQSLYTTSGDAKSLAALLERRLERVTDPDQRVALEVSRSRALADVGEREAAKAALSAALAENPEHVEALEAFADLCVAEGDWSSAEQAFIRLARHVPDPKRQAQIYKKLGELYDGAIPNPQRAELAYQEVLKRDPDDTGAVERLIAVFGKLGQPERAVELATRLLERATGNEEKRDRSLGLALVLEQIVGDRKRAAAAFEKARKDWPHDSAVLRALVEHHLRAGEARTVQVLLDRAATDARRALSTGRFEPGFFETLATVAELRGSNDAAAVAQATLGAISGEPVGLPGAGSSAADPRLDELVAPELLSLSLRSLLKKTSAAIDAAYPVDLKALRATPLPLDAYTEHANELAQTFGIRGVELYSSPALGGACLAGSSTVPRVIFGQNLLSSSDDAARYFLLTRALKLVQSGAASLARIPPIELAPVICGLLAIYAPNFAPQGVDAKKVSEAQARLQSAGAANVDADVPVLALEVIGSLGNRSTQLGTALQQWATRTALLAVGDPFGAIRALGLASGGSGGPPAEGPDRLRWIVRHAEARDLAIFSVSDQYSEARARLGVHA